MAELFALFFFTSQILLLRLQLFLHVVDIVGVSDAGAAPATMLDELGAAAAQPRPHAQLLDVATREPLHKTVVGPELDEVKAQIRSFLDRTR